MRLTKSLFVDYASNPKLARRKLNSPDTYKIIRKTESVEQEEHIMAIGQAVEDVVKQLLEQRYNTTALDLMPAYHKPSTSDQTPDEDYDPTDTDADDEPLTNPTIPLHRILAQTIQAIENRTPILYQPTFQYNDCLVRADFMVRDPTKWGYELIEVKAKSSVRKDVTDDGEKKPIGPIEKQFIHDVSFQQYVIDHVLAQHNLPTLVGIQIAHLNKTYIKHGPLDLEQLITFTPAGGCYEQAVVQRNKPTTITIDNTLLTPTEIEPILANMRNYLCLSEEEVNRNYLRTGTKYLEYFGQPKDKVFGTVMWPGLHHADASYIQDLYYQGRHKLSDLTDDEIAEFNAANQTFIHNYRQTTSTNKPIINADAIHEVFSTFKFPICFYDYETISVPVPLLDNTRPYLQTVVQYSLHKYYEDGTMKHYGGVFTWEGIPERKPVHIDSNPNAIDEDHDVAVIWSYKDLLDQMLQDIGDDLDINDPDQTSTFVVRYKWFENSRNNEIGTLFPDLAPAFAAINENTFDLMDIVSKGHYIDHRCKWSASIKKVMPILVPSMDYAGLEIGRGDKAMMELYKLITGKIPEAESQKTIENLLIYCCQDTMAMVRIYEALRHMIQ